MFLIRQATIDDAPTLLKLAKMVHFINLPADSEIIRTRIMRSRRSFAGQAPSLQERQFMFVMEETGTGNVIGTSSIVSCVSWPGRPHTYLQVRKRELYSTDLQTGQVHVTVQLKTDESGPTEIGGLVLGPSYRGHSRKLGLSLSLIRFHLIGLHREWFADRILAEMMGPLTPDSRNLFWESFGRRFINLSFAEADLFCQRSKEFITSLFPTEEICISLLPPDARNLIGKVGTETEPAKRLLEGIGFQYRGHVDPFDGGPYLEAKTDEIDLVESTTTYTLGKPVNDYPCTGFVSTQSQAGFRAIRTAYAQSPQTVSISPEAAALLGAEPGDTVGLTPLTSTSAVSSRQSEAKPSSRRARSAAPPEAVP